MPFFMASAARRWRGLGFDAWWPMEKLAVMGYVDALKHYREISGIRRQLKKTLARDQAGYLHRGRCA
jgi:lipid-A-disaccharide synthase